MDSVGVPSPQVQSDLLAVAETHRLSRIGREKLARIATGAVPGNRDRPLFQLANTIHSGFGTDLDRPKGLFDLLALAAKHQPPPSFSRLSLALLDFLATMDDYRFFEDIDRAVTGLLSSGNEQAVAAATSVFAACIHRYRTDHLPYENRRQAFSAIRGYFAEHRPNTGLPEDGDAIEFWHAIASSDQWTTFAATLAALVDFVDASALRLAGSQESFEALSLLGFEAAEDLFADVAEAEPGFDDALGQLAAARLKVLKGPEIEELRRFSATWPALRRWRRSGSAALSFVPIQNILVQAKRDGVSAAGMGAVAACDNAEGYGDKMRALEATRLVCIDIAVLYRNLGNENGPGSSTTDMETKRRIAGMMRRQSFAKVESDALRAEINDLLPALATIVERLELGLGILTNWPAPSRENAFNADRAQFVETFLRLYCSEGT